MALQSSIGPRTGPIDAMSVVVTVWDDTGAEITESQAVTRAQLDAPTDLFGVAQDAVPSADQLGPYAYDVTVNYRVRQLSKLQRPVPGETDEIKRYVPPMYTKPRTMHQFVQPVAVYDGSNGNDVTSEQASLKWVIDMPGGSSFLLVTPGHTFEPLPVTRGFHFYMNNVSVTDAYLDTIEDMVSRGVFNNASWFGRPAGTVQFVSFSASERTPDDWDLDFGFGYKAVQENVQISNEVTIPYVKGNEYYYSRMKPIPIEQGGVVISVVQKLEHVVLGQVWEEDDFGNLNLE